MSESLIDKVRNYTICGLLLGTSALVALTGCGSTRNSNVTPAMALSVIANANAMKTNDPKKIRAWVATSDFADKYGNRENALDAANSGKDDKGSNNENQNNNNQNNNNENQNNKIQQEEEKLPEGMVRVKGSYLAFITCNYMEDLNKDGIYRRSDDEYINIKKKFTLKEKITYAITDVKVEKGDKITMVIKNNNGEVLSENSYGEETESSYMTTGSWYEPGRLKESNTAFWYQNGKYIGQIGVIIEEEKKEEPSSKK